MGSVRRQAMGYTVVELLIIVAIIALLAAIAIPNLLLAYRRAKIFRALADTKQIVSQTQLYYEGQNAYPAGITDLNNAAYISRTADPFGVTSTQDYGYGASATHIWSLSVGPNAAAPGTIVTTAPDNTTNNAGTTCTGVVGWSNFYGSIVPAGC